MTDRDATKTDAEAAAADAVPAATVTTDVPPAAADSNVGAAAAKVLAKSSPMRCPRKNIDITDPSLTAGIPGDGPLTNGRDRKVARRSEESRGARSRAAAGLAPAQRRSRASTRTR